MSSTPFPQSTRRRKAGWLRCLIVAIAVVSPAVAEDDTAWLEYHPGIGCPSREVVVKELLRRMSYRVPPRTQKLSIHIEYSDGQYVGRVWLDVAGVSAPRQVQNESCDQVTHALALMGALLLEDEQRPSAEPSALPAPPAADAELLHSSVTTPASAPDSGRRTRPRPIQQFTVGPWLALTSDGLVTPAFVRLGGRVGAVATYHPRAHDYQQTLRLSVSRIASGTLAKAAERFAELQSTSVRLDACHGWRARQVTSISGCALFDIGQYSGTGHVSEVTYEKRALLARAGAALYVRYALISGLSLHAALGALLPFARPSFVFAESDGLPAETIHRVRQIGPIADLGLELHFW